MLSGLILLSLLVVGTPLALTVLIGWWAHKETQWVRDEEKELEAEESVNQNTRP